MLAALALALTTMLTGLVPPSALARSEPPTMDAILSRDAKNALSVSWLNDQTLIAEIKKQSKKSTSAILIPLNSGAVRALGEGAHVRAARTGWNFIQLKDNHWIVRNGQDAQTDQLALPSHVTDSDRLNWRTPSWSPDGNFVALAHTRYGGMQEPQPTTVEGVRVIDVGRSLDKRPWMTTTLFSVGTGRHAQSNSIEVHGWVADCNWGPDQKLYFAPYRPFEQSDGFPHTAVYSWKPDEKEVKEVFRVRGMIQSMHPVISPDGRWMAVAYDQRGGNFVSLFVVDLSSGAARRLTYDLRVANGSYVWAPDSKSLYFTARHGGWDRLYRVDLDHNVTLISKGNERRFDVQISPNGDKLSYQTENGYGRQDIRVLSLSTGKEDVAFVIDDPTNEFRLGKFQQIQWANGEGQKLFGFLIFPPNFDASRKYPLLTYVHGGGPGSRLYLNAGPITVTLSPGPLEWHVWAALGYVLFVPDYRSTGSYGPAAIIARHEKRDFLGVKADTRDIESGVEHMLAKKYIDSERVAIIGHSAGGARVSLLLTRSNLFHAAILNEAIASDPLSTLIWATTGINTGRPFEGILLKDLGVRLSEAPGRYQNTFLFDGYKNRTPTLILVGGAKSNPVSPLASEILFSTLRQYEVPTRMIRFIDEAHTYSTVPAALLAFREMKAWLNAYLTNS